MKWQSEWLTLPTNKTINANIDNEVESAMANLDAEYEALVAEYALLGV